jgi:hypothetical protein
MSAIAGGVAFALYALVQSTAQNTASSKSDKRTDSHAKPELRSARAFGDRRSAI